MSTLVRSKKTLALLATCGMMFQLTGCLGGVGKWVVAGFGLGLGGIPADFINAQFIDPLVNPPADGLP